MRLHAVKLCMPLRDVAVIDPDCNSRYHSGWAVAAGGKLLELDAHENTAKDTEAAVHGQIPWHAW